ncbi:unnamed protein product [Aphanomyces euteiches]|uniref:Uncharacterized protein n=1 Tax=Aphanomyces euteiches TaxID=100861 RepID=A0A6G0WPI3_9STRA|nr:hypothetical protein Ae201684_013016 [Aphanomyces euteiches]KAH9076605.1 hypothetical protein Ae201684P_010545 [Aphanomyces euteiches]
MAFHTKFHRTFAAASTITSLVANLGAVYVTADPAITHATASLHYDSPDVLEAFNISESRHEWTLGWTGGKRVTGRYTIELRLPARTLECVSFTASGMLAISSGVLAASPSVHLSINSSGPGQLNIQDDTLVASGLTLWHTGSGSLQLTCRSIAADVVDVTSRGWGVVALCTSRLATTDLSVANHSSAVIYIDARTRAAAHDVRVVNRGSGAVRMAFDSLTTDELMLVVASSGPILLSVSAALNAARIDSRVTSSGSLHLACSPAGSTCAAHRIAMPGSGDLSTNVEAATTETNASGSGCVRQTAPCTVQSLGSVESIKLLPLSHPLAA